MQHLFIFENRFGSFVMIEHIKSPKEWSPDFNPLTTPPNFKLVLPQNIAGGALRLYIHTEGFRFSCFTECIDAMFSPTASQNQFGRPVWSTVFKSAT